MTLNLLILGAGYGTRLKPLTDHVPKPLLEIDMSQTILSRLLNQFRRYDVIKDIWVNVSFNAHYFTKYLLTLDKQIRPNVIFEPTLLGGACTVFEFSKNCDGPLLVIHGDLVLSDEYVDRMLGTISETSNFLMFCHQRARRLARSLVTADENGMVTKLDNSIPETPVDTEVLVNSGAYFFPLLVDLGPSPQTETEIAESILQYLTSNQQLYISELNSERISVDSFKQLEKARKLLSNSQFFV